MARGGHRRLGWGNAARSAKQAEWGALWPDALLLSPSLGPTGDRVWDLSGQQRHGTITNPNGMWRTAAVGSVLDCAVAGDAISVPMPAMSTWTVWMYTVRRTSGIGTVYGRYFATDTVNTALLPETYLNYLSFTLLGVSPIWNKPVPVVANRWFHLAVTYDGSVVRSYIDGAPGPASASGVSGAMPAATWYIGNAPALNRTADGAYAQFGVDTRAYSPSEIAKLYALGDQLLAPAARRLVAVPGGAPVGVNLESTGTLEATASVSFSVSRSLQATGTADATASVTSSTSRQLQPVGTGTATASVSFDVQRLLLPTGTFESTADISFDLQRVLAATGTNTATSTTSFFSPRRLAGTGTYEAAASVAFDLQRNLRPLSLNEASASIGFDLQRKLAGVGSLQASAAVSFEVLRRLEAVGLFELDTQIAFSTSRLYDGRVNILLRPLAKVDVFHREKARVTLTMRPAARVTTIAALKED